eukprot:gene18519-18799_t
MIKQNFFGEFDSENNDDLPDDLFEYLADHEPLQEIYDKGSQEGDWASSLSFVKDKWDSRGNFLLWKDNYSPFDKSSPTAHLDAFYAWLSVAQRYKMQVESADKPENTFNPMAAYLCSSKKLSMAYPNLENTEAELIATSDMVDLTFVAKLYLEFLNVQIPMPIRVMQDNTSAITIAYLARPSIH